MENALELTVIVKDSERTHRQKFLVYDDFKMNQDDATIQQVIKEALELFPDKPDKIIVKSQFEVV